MARLLLALAVCLGVSPSLLSGQTPEAPADTGQFGIRLDFPAAPLQLSDPAALRAPWLGAPRVLRAVRTEIWDSTIRAASDSVRAETARAYRLMNLYGVDARPLLAADEDPEAAERRRGFLGLSRTSADVEMDGQVRLEIRTDRLRNERCVPALLLDPNSGCRGGFKAPRIDNQVNLRSAGIIGRRVHLNVDYDSERDFSANNNVQVYYQGLEDEIIRRVEVGTVVFRPPPSRFLTASIPANNFGVNATFEVGRMQFQALAATQKGSQVAERVYTVGQTTSQPQDQQVRDLDFETGRFFWVVDPTTLPGYPRLDILNLESAAVPPADRPAQVRVYRYRAALNQSGAQPNLGGLRALARSADGSQTFGPVRWELLIQGTDYYLDPSGLWLALGTKLDDNDYLAVSYVTASGARVGSFPATDNPEANDSLRLVLEPKQGPERVTFRHEMRQIYRVAGPDLEPASLQVNLSVNRSERPQSGEALTYLSLLGLSIPTDPNIFDRDNRLFPRTQDPEAVPVLNGSYIVYPHVQPFADASRLTPAELSDSIYRTPLFLLSEGTTAKFYLRLRYNSSGAGDRSNLNLGTFQIREGSEQIIVGGRRLERGVDYSIAYELGRVTFLNPDALFGGGATQVTARFEEQGIFAIAPTTIFGFSSRYSLGETGGINFIGMYQKEQTAFNRPQLGFEASAHLVGGVATDLHFKPQGITRFLNGLTSRPATAPSLLDIGAEFALTKPDQNRSGEAYIEEFEGDAGIPVTLGEAVWGFGAMPQDGAGTADIGFGAGFEAEDAVALTWQNLVPGGDNQAVEVRPEDIDTLIRIAGRSERLETVAYVTLHADTAGGVVQRNNASRWSLPARPFEPRWRAVVTPLSSTGVDLSRNEFLEFWVFQPGSRSADSAGVRLIFDIGKVSEDALAIAPESLTVAGADTVYTGRQLVGLNVLDTERGSTDIFNAQTDDVGILGDRPPLLFDASGAPVNDLPLCRLVLSSAVQVFPWGDLSSDCSNGNGTLDTEDLDGDNVLNARGADEQVFRYVVALQRTSPYFVRTGVQTQDAQGRTAGWELYRIPIRDPDAVVGSPNLRLIQHLRLTVAAPPDAGGSDIVARFALARMRFVGSPWVRRSDSPIRGLAGATGNSVGEVIASVVSTENRLDLGYESPPGVIEAGSRRSTDQGTLGTQINEKAMRLIGRQMEVGDRAEAYLRFPASPQSALAYRQLRVWMRGRGAGWEEGDLQAFIKLGSDARNFYLYRAGARSTTWEPEFVVDLEVWRSLRAAVEVQRLTGPPVVDPACGIDDPNVYIACDGPYLVYMADPGVNPPNLVSIQEVSAGIYRVGGSVALGDAELWVNDIRLTSPVSETGTAAAVDARLVASDVGNLTVSYIRQDGQFRQINQDPTYRTTGALQLNSGVQLDRFLPTSLGLSVPFRVAYTNSDVDPQLLTGTDLRGEDLAGLRSPNAWTASYVLSVRRSQKGKRWLTRAFADPLSLNATLNKGRSRSELSSARSDAYSLTATYSLQLQRAGFTLPFGGVISGLPKWLRESEAGKGLQAAKFSLVPTNVRWSSGLSRAEGDYRSFSVPIVRDDDALVRPTLSLTHLWRNAAGLTWQPLGMLRLDGDLASTRDLRVYPDSSSLGRLAYAERRFLLGIPVGVERDRNVSTALALTPRVASWLRPRFTTSSSFVLSRTLNSRSPVREAEDSGAFILPQTLNNNRARELGVSVDVSRALRGIWSDSSWIGKFVARVRPVDLSSQLTRTSTFDLAAFDPGLGYQLALGGRDRFLSQEGTGAISAAEIRTASVSSGADLPFGLTATVSYALTRTERFRRLGEGFAETVIRQREWPVANLRWTRTFRGGPFATMAAGLGIRRREGTSTQPSQGGGGALSSTLSSSVIPDLQLVLRNGMAFNLGLSSRDQRTSNNGNETRLDQDDLTGTFSYSFRLPRSLSQSRKTVRSSVTTLFSTALTCLTNQQGGGDCLPISDVRRQELRGGLDTDLLRTLSGGLEFGYTINDARHLSRRTSQIFILASFQLSLFAADYR